MGRWSERVSVSEYIQIFKDEPVVDKEILKSELISKVEEIQKELVLNGVHHSLKNIVDRVLIEGVEVIEYMTLATFFTYKGIWMRILSDDTFNSDLGEIYERTTLLSKNSQ